jgi:DNA-binding transcriptional LysR family regulator
MNVHHLELFYYVAKHGGISAAVRAIPYGIQQPAVSGQMGKLEEDVGVKLFERSPFKLTPAGVRLFSHVQPFFEGIEGVADRIRESSVPRLRVGAAELVIRDHLHSVVDRLRAHHPRMRLALRSGFTVELEAWLRAGEIDLAITPLEGRSPARLNCARMLRMPLVLVVPHASKLKSAAELWKQSEIIEPLISVPATEAISRIFRKGLQRLRVTWPTAIESSSLELVARYVERGYGLGVSVALPEIVKHPGVRVLPLEGFDPVEVAILWQGEASLLIQLVLEESRRYARELWPDWVWAEEGA